MKDIEWNPHVTKRYGDYITMGSDFKPHVRVRADLEPLWDWMLNNPYSKSVDTHSMVLLDMCDTALRKKYRREGRNKA